MAVTKPTAYEVIAWTGVNRYILDDAAIQIEERLEDYIDQAEADVALAVGESAFDAHAWTARQLSGLRRAIAGKAAAKLLRAVELTKVTGTQEPLLMEDAGNIADVIDRLEAEADTAVGLVASGLKSSPVKPFAMPAVSASTFTHTSANRDVVERNDLLDERDNVPADDLDRG